MVLYKDISSVSSNVLSRDYCHGKHWTVELKSKSTKPQFINAASALSGGVLDASSVVKHSIGLSAIELRMANSGAGHLNTNLRLQNSGVTLCCKVDRKSGKTENGDSMELGAELLKPYFHGKATIEPFTQMWTLSGLGSYKPDDQSEWKVGGSLTGSKSIESAVPSVGISYQQKSAKQNGFLISVKSTPDQGTWFGKIIGNAHTSLNNGESELGTEIVHTVATGQTAVNFGGLWKINKDKNTMLRAKVSHDGKVAAALTHPLSEGITGCIGAQIDALKATKPGSVQCGFKLNVMG